MRNAQPQRLSTRPNRQRCARGCHDVRTRGQSFVQLRVDAGLKPQEFGHRPRGQHPGAVEAALAEDHPCELREVFHGGQQPAGRGEDRQIGVHRWLNRAIAGPHMARGQPLDRARRGIARPGHAQRVKQPRPGKFVEPRSGGARGDLAGQDHRGVRIDDMLAGRVNHRAVRGKIGVTRDHRRRRRNAVPGHRQPGAMRQDLAQRRRYRLPVAVDKLLRLGQVAVDRGVKREPPGLDLGHHQRGGQQLADRTRSENRFERGRAPGGRVGLHRRRKPQPPRRRAAPGPPSPACRPRPSLRARPARQALAPARRRRDTRSAQATAGAPGASSLL